MHILIVDNFDSFTNNIAQYVFEATGQVPTVVPNTVSLGDLDIQKFSGIILSPGPGHPNNDEDFGVCRDIINHCQLPILGVCLGHQGINCQFGGVVSHAPKPVHGYKSKITHHGNGLFAGIPQNFDVVRYHSLVCTEVADSLDVTAYSEDGLVMGVAHKEKPIWGVQFHPESIDSDYGMTLIENYIHLIQSHRVEQKDQNKISQALESVAGIISLSIQYERLNISSNAENIFSNNFSNKSSAFWLDSELSEGQLSRYSVMGSAQPNEALTFSYDVNEQKLSILGPLGESSVYGDYFELMDQLVSQLKPARFDDLPFPFQCGLIGYLGYELKALVGAENHHHSSTPDALFFLPQNMLVFDHEEDAVYLCNLWGKPITVAIPDMASEQKETTNAAFAPGAIAADVLELEDNVAQYIEKINHCLHEIRNGESYEICLTNRARMPFENDAFQAYLKMRTASPVPYGAFIKTPEFSILSASPETFLKVDASRKVSSKPIKGTRPRGSTNEHDKKLKKDLKKSEKDRAENLMIVDLVRHDLNNVCLPGTVRVTKAFDIETYSSVHQLVSTVEGKLKPSLGPFGVIKACFPGGSMTGAPKLRTMSIIDKLENSARGIYSGSLGWVGMDGVTNLSIVIRTAVIQKGMGEFGVGGAIVAASSPKEEIEETLVKASVPFYSLSAD
ncbi:aminodeoxychorismate synthase component I [Vibrio sp. Of7-15]|uniref:aminodeoxychorismate synthase component I n=1 Tax=Vibrio sp. Of7-15 TaxID=2724879 RepID=UPI001EF3B3ED|nr:aminodeoxychorismate synthase component I [Vibrio sp. Of7-15]MCG7498971.1 aminodeoxychorismate synthase component I [Vibrio sp. Of7-15]